MPLFYLLVDDAIVILCWVFNREHITAIGKTPVKLRHGVKPRTVSTYYKGITTKLQRNV